MNLLFCRKIMA